MKKIISVIAILTTLLACDKWTEERVQHPSDLTKVKRSDAYYANLRAYKQTEHEVAFGWFGNWTGTGISLENSMRGLPDSTDFVSLWGQWLEPTEEMLKDYYYTKELKGTRALGCFICQNIGDQLTPPGESQAEYWGYQNGTEEEYEAAIKKYVAAIVAVIDKYGYDGFDIDYEPNFGHKGNLGGHTKNITTFVKELGKHFGPMSGTGRLLVVDGEPHSMPAELGPYFDYFIVQAYRCYGDSDLDARLRRTIDAFEGVLTPQEVAAKFIVTENFESYASNGGYPYTDRFGNMRSSYFKDESGNPSRLYSLEGMARWRPIINGEYVRKGGIGTYHMEYEYKISGKEETYPYLRRGIQIQNPRIF